jgi:hypothetical protein
LDGIGFLKIAGEIITKGGNNYQDEESKTANLDSPNGEP